MTEFFGQLFFFRTRVWVYFLILAVPFLSSFLLLAMRWAPLQEAEFLMSQAEPLSLISLQKQEKRTKLLQRYLGADPNFIQSLEAIPLLSNKRYQLKQMIENPACAQRGVLRTRLEQWEQTKNRLEFAEEAIRSSKRLKEREVRLKNPVEVEQEDLERLLSQVEDLQIGSFSPSSTAPQMIFKEFCLTRKKDLYQLDFSLLQREFFP